VRKRKVRKVRIGKKKEEEAREICGKDKNMRV